MSAFFLTRRAALLGFGAAGLGLLSGCETAPPPRRFAQITFRYAPPIQLSVGAVEVQVPWQAPVGGGHAELEMPVDPVATAARWGTDRLAAAGGSGKATVSVLEMSVVETQLKTKTGITGAFTTDQSERYDMRLIMRVQASDPARGATAETTVSAERSQTVLEGITLAEREDIWYGMIEKLMGEMDTRLTASIRQDMPAFVLTSG